MKNLMSIAYFTDTYLPNIDGVVRSVVDLRNSLEKNGNKIYIFTSGKKPAIESRDSQNVFYHRSLPFPLYPQYKVALFPYLNSIKEARLNNIEIVHSHAMASMGLAAIATAKSLKVPSIGTFHTMLPKAVKLISFGKKSEEIASNLIWKTIEIFYSGFDLTTAPSNVIAKELDKHNIAPVKVMPNGVDIKKFCPDKNKSALIKKELGYEEKTKLVLVAGRISPEKNVQTIVKAARKVIEENDKVRFLITGEGPSVKNVMAEIKKQGLEKNIRMMGFLPEEKIKSFYQAADIFATASTFETQGLAALEALACSTPVVAANAMALPEMIKEGYNGYLFEEYDYLQCAEKILKLIESKESEKKKFEKNARKTAQRYSLEKVSKLWEELYRDSIDNYRK